MEKLYKSLKQSLKEYEDQKRTAWESTIESGGNEKLKLFLLTRKDDNMLCVNFDNDLVKLLREIRYLQLIDMHVPETGLTIYKNVDIFRDINMKLDLIVDM